MTRGKCGKIFLIVVLCFICTAFAVGCSKIAKKYYTVTFIDGNTVYCRSKVERGKKLDFPTAPERDDNYIFDGWYFDDAAERIWNVQTDRVNQDTVLWSNFLYVSELPGNISMSDTPFSSTVTWLQRGVSPQTEYGIKLHKGMLISKSKYAYSENSDVETSGISGENGGVTLVPYKEHNDVYEVQWTAPEAPQGGVYSIEISCANGTAKQDDLQFKGAGSKGNPYLLTNGGDLAVINSTDIPSGSYYKVEQSFSVRLSSKSIIGNTFDGIIDGNGKTVTIIAGGCGLFGTLGENALIEDLNVDGAIDDTTDNCVGIISSVNNGKIDYCTVSAGIESNIGEVGVLVGDENSIVGGAGGVAGVNNGTISNTVYSGGARAKVGAGGIAVINNGKITNCTFSGTLGAGNAIESGSSTNSMSYMGGIAAVNYGKIELCSSTGRALAQRSLSGNGSNNNIGGIAAYNTAGGSIERCFINSTRVYGNNNVGGIVGENSGAVEYCYATANYRSNIESHNYIGGSSNVGGIVGLTNEGATVKNCYVAANVYAYNGAAYKVAQTCEQCVYLKGNLDDRNYTVTTNNVRESVAAKELIYPEGDNIAVELTDAIKEEYKAKTYTIKLDKDQYAVLNGNSGFYKSETSLTFDRDSNVKDRVIKVTVVVDGQSNSSYTLKKVSGNKILPIAPDLEEKYVAGYAFVAGSDRFVFADGVTIGYSDLEMYNRENIALYPVYTTGTRPESKVLNVAVYGRFIDGDMVGELLGAFKNSQYFVGYEDVHYTVLTEYKVDDYAVAVTSGNGLYGRYNISFGHNDLAVGQREDIPVSVIRVDTGKAATRQVGVIGKDSVASSFVQFLATDEAKKIMNPNYIEVTLYNGNNKISTGVVVSNGSLTLTSPEAENGLVFAGWSVNKNPIDGETLFKNSVTYAALSAIAQNKAVTLYARFTENVSNKLKVAVWTKYVDKDTVDELLDAFKKSGNYQVECTAVVASMNNNFQAQYGDGGYDVAFAYRSSSMDSSYDRYAPVFIYNEDRGEFETLRVGLSNNDKVSQDFEAFLASESAVNIMKPDLVVAIHSSASASSVYITDEEIANLKTAFDAYLTEKSYVAKSIKIDWQIIANKNGNGFASVLNGDSSIDVAIGGNNMDTSTPTIQFDSTYGKYAVKSDLFANTSRKVGILPGSVGNIYAKLLYSFMTGKELNNE